MSETMPSRTWNNFNNLSRRYKNKSEDKTTDRLVLFERPIQVDHDKTLINFNFE